MHTDDPYDKPPDFLPKALPEAYLKTPDMTNAERMTKQEQLVTTQMARLQQQAKAETPTPAFQRVQPVQGGDAGFGMPDVPKSSRHTFGGW